MNEDSIQKNDDEFFIIQNQEDISLIIDESQSDGIEKSADAIVNENANVQNQEDRLFLGEESIDTNMDKSQSEDLICKYRM